MKAARGHFFAHGLERASLDAIAAEAGVSKMNFYSNFGSKEALFEAVVRDRTDRVMGGSAGVEARLAVREQFLALTRDEEALRKFRSVYGAACAYPESCQAFHRREPSG